MRNKLFLFKEAYELLLSGEKITRFGCDPGWYLDYNPNFGFKGELYVPFRPAPIMWHYDGDFPWVNKHKPYEFTEEDKDHIWALYK